MLSGTRAEALEALKGELGDRAPMSRLPIFPTRPRSKPCPKRRKQAAGPIDILVNNAGITRDNLFLRMKDDEWDQVIAVNLTAAFRLSRGVLRGMMKKRWGRIIPITSVVGSDRQSGPGQLCRRQGGPDRHDQIAGRRSRLPQHHRQLRGARLHPTAMTDVLDAKQRETQLLSRIPAGRMGRGGGNRRRRRLSGLRGGRLCDRRNHPCQWRNGDDFIGLNAVDTAPVCPRLPLARANGLC